MRERGIGLCFFWSFVVFASSDMEDSRRDFERAAALLTAGQEDQAIVSFGDFLRRYPASQQADEAQFFMGEVYYRKKQYFEALKEFRKTQVKKNVDAETLGQATLRAGECWKLLGNPTFARIEWEAVSRKFPEQKLGNQAKDFLGALDEAKQQ